MLTKKVSKPNFTINKNNLNSDNFCGGEIDEIHRTTNLSNKINIINSNKPLIYQYNNEPYKKSHIQIDLLSGRKAYSKSAMNQNNLDIDMQESSYFSNVFEKKDQHIKDTIGSSIILKAQDKLTDSIHKISYNNKKCKIFRDNILLDSFSVNDIFDYILSFFNKSENIKYKTINQFMFSITQKTDLDEMEISIKTHLESPLMADLDFIIKIINDLEIFILSPITDTDFLNFLNLKNKKNIENIEIKLMSDVLLQLLHYSLKLLLTSSSAIDFNKLDSASKYSAYITCKIVKIVKDEINKMNNDNKKLLSLINKNNNFKKSLHEKLNKI
jgi:hypothetical protein